MINSRRGALAAVVAALLWFLAAETVTAQTAGYLPALSRQPTRDSICRCWWISGDLFEFLYHEPQPDVECWREAVHGPYGYGSDMHLYFQWPAGTAGFALMHTHHSSLRPHGGQPGSETYSCDYAARLPHREPLRTLFNSQTLPGRADYDACMAEMGAIMDELDLTCPLIDVTETANDY